MRRRLVRFIGVFLALFMVGSVEITTAGAAAPVARYSLINSNTLPRITWSPSSIRQTMVAGSSLRVPVRFSSTKSFTGATLRVSSATSSFVGVSSFPTSVTAKVPYTATVTFSVPASYTGTSISGSIAAVGRQALDKPLKFSIAVRPAASGPSPGSVVPDQLAAAFPLGVFDDRGMLNTDTFSTLIDDARAHNLDGAMITNCTASNGGTLLDVSDSKGFNSFLGPMVELRSEWFKSTTASVDIATARTIIYPLVDQLSSHQSLKGYYVVDEPTLDLQTKVSLAVQAFQERDPVRPAYPVLIGTDRAAPIESAAGSKAMVIDVYPFGWDNAPADTTMSGFGYSMDMVSYIRQATATKPASTPLWIILQGHQFGDGTGTFHLRQPSPVEARLENWLAIGEGAKGIFWFLYTSQPDQGLVGFRDNPALYAEIGNLAKRVGALRPQLLTMNKTIDRFTVSGAANPYVSTLTDGTSSFAVVVNRSVNANSISVGTTLGGRLKDLETGATYGLNTPISFGGGDGKVFQLVP